MTVEDTIDDCETTTDVIDERQDSGDAAARAVEELKANGALNDFFTKVASGEIDFSQGDGGFVAELVKAGLEAGLQAEMTSHLGYAPRDRAGKAETATVNGRNGSFPKTVSTSAGDVELAIPRDRAGSFTPRLVPKGKRRAGGLDDMIISLYAGGMTIREIQHHLASTIGTELSHETIANITDAVLKEVVKWQERPLDEFYPVMYLDAIRLKVRDGGHVRSKAAHIAIGVDMDGIKHVLGIWVQDNEGASFWAHVCAELANRGVKDVLVVCCDGLTGLPEAVEATWPDVMVQTCVVHLIRAANRFVNYKDRKAVAKSMKPIYQAANENAAQTALEEFTAEWGKKYPSAISTWKNAWDRFTPFLQFPPALRRVIYTTNAIESLNYQLRKVTKNRGQFPNDDAAVKLLWLAICNIEDKRAREREKEKGKEKKHRKAAGRLIEGQVTTNWKQALAQLAAAYPDRIEPYL